MDTIRIAAYAKLNLTLDVLRRRADGYHELSSVMQSVDLHDVVSVSTQARGIDLVSDADLPQDSDNVAWRAAERFFQITGISGGASITLEKGIPTAAGLAGGSADAAAVLTALNILYEVELTLEEMQIIGSSLGADVPFCLAGGTQLAEGIGDRLTRLPELPRWWVVLAKPDDKVATKDVYEGLDSGIFGSEYTQAFVDHLYADQLDQALQSMGNAMESYTLAKIPECRLWKERLAETGAASVLMSGSGPTVFAVYTEEDEAQAAWEQYSTQGNLWMCRLTHSGMGVLDRHVGGS